MMSVLAEEKALSGARYYSHVLPLAGQRPFDLPELLVASFIGEFVAPLVLPRPQLLYWFGVARAIRKVSGFHCELRGAKA